MVAAESMPQSGLPVMSQTAAFDDKDDINLTLDNAHRLRTPKRQLPRQRTRQIDSPRSPALRASTPQRASRFFLLADASSPNYTPDASPLAASPSIGELIADIADASSLGPTVQTLAPALGAPTRLVPSPLTSHTHRSPLPRDTLSAGKLVSAGSPTPSNSKPHSTLQNSGSPVKAVPIPAFLHLSQSLHRRFRSGSMQIQPSQPKISDSNPTFSQTLPSSEPQPGYQPQAQPTAEIQTDADIPGPFLGVPDADIDTYGRVDTHTPQSQSQSEVHSDSQKVSMSVEQSQWLLQTQAPYAFPSQSQSQ